MTTNTQKILLVYIEPTTYIIDLLAKLTAIIPYQLEVVFISENYSQQWDICLNSQYTILPTHYHHKFFFILKLFVKNKYSLVHLAGWSEPVMWLCIFLAKIYQIPVTLETDSQQPYSLPAWKRIIKRLLYPTLFKYINLFLAAGSRQVNYLKFYGVSPKAIKLVQMTVDVMAIRKQIALLSSVDKITIRQNYNIPQTDTVFLFVGRLEKSKGIVDLITAFINIAQQNISLLIVGDGSLTPLVTKLAKLYDKIYYAGHLNAHDLVSVYFAADVFVLPSHCEAWGLVINEAMAAGLPTIVSEQVGCIDDLVDHNQTGLIIAAKNIAAIEESLQQLSSCANKRNMMANWATQKISTWTLENEASKVYQAWRELI